MDVKWKDIKSSDSFDEIVRRSTLHLEGDYKKLGIWVRRMFVIDKCTLYAYTTKGGGGSLNGWCIKDADVQVEYGDVYGRDGRNLLNISVSNVYRITLSLDSIYEQAIFVEALQHGGAKICHKALQALQMTKYNPSIKLRNQFLIAPKLSARMMDVHWTFEELNTAEDFLFTKSNSESDIRQFCSRDAANLTPKHSSEDNLITQTVHSSVQPLPICNDKSDNQDEGKYNSPLTVDFLNVTLNSETKSENISNDLNIKKNFDNNIRCDNISDRTSNSYSNEMVEQRDTGTYNYNLPIINTNSNNNYTFKSRPTNPVNSVILHSGYLDTSFNIDNEPKRSYVHLMSDKLFVNYLNEDNSSSKRIINLREISNAVSTNDLTWHLSTTNDENIIMKSSSAGEAKLWKEKIEKEVGLIQRKSKPPHAKLRHKRLTRYQHLTHEQIEHRTKELMKTLEAPCENMNTRQQNNYDNDNIKESAIFDIQTVKLSNENTKTKAVNNHNSKDENYFLNIPENNITTNGISSDKNTLIKNPNNKMFIGRVKNLANKYDQLNNDVEASTNFNFKNKQNISLLNDVKNVTFNKYNGALSHCKTYKKLHNVSRYKMVSIKTGYVNKFTLGYENNANSVIKENHRNNLFVRRGKYEKKKCLFKESEKLKVPIKKRILIKTDIDPIEKCNVSKLRNQFEQISLVENGKN